MAGHLMPAFAVSALYQKCPASLIGALSGKGHLEEHILGVGNLVAYLEEGVLLGLCALRERAEAGQRQRERKRGAKLERVAA